MVCSVCPLDPVRTYWDEESRQCKACKESKNPVLDALAIPVAAFVVVVCMILAYRWALPSDGREDLTDALKDSSCLSVCLPACLPACLRA